jgi:hypothetical protein
MSIGIVLGWYMFWKAELRTSYLHPMPNGAGSLLRPQD